MKQIHISLISFAAITLCGCSLPQPVAHTPPPQPETIKITADSVTIIRRQPTRTLSDFPPAVQTPTRAEDAKLLQALEACAPVGDPLVSVSAPDYATSRKVHEILEPQLRATTFSTALARTIEQATLLGINISVKLSTPKTCKIGRIQEILGEEDAKYDADVNEIPDTIRKPVTWYRYGWGEFAVHDDVVVAVRGKTDGFRRKE